MGTLATLGTLDVGVNYHVCWFSPWVHGCMVKPVSGVRLGACRCAAGGLSAGELSGTGQRQGTGPDPGPRAAAGALAVGVPSCD